jgi:hypothetical protein
MPVEDEKVKQVMERRDLDAEEKLILIDLLMREPKPEKIISEVTGTTEYIQPMAVATDEQIAERTRLSPSTVNRRINGTKKDRNKSLRGRNFLTKKQSKGGVGNRYHVRFPRHRKSRSAKEEETRQPEPENTQ